VNKRERVAVGEVSRDEFRASLDAVEADVAHLPAAHGVHGPGTISWEVSREVILFLGGGCASLLQLAHPYVAHAIEEHSATRSDPVGRFNRTFQHVYAMVLGDRESALRSARRVRAIHEAVRGEIDEDVGRFREGHPYLANDADALLWVHATLTHTSIQVYEATVRELTAEERDRYWEESKRFAWLFGIPDAILPRDWKDFERYWWRTLESDVLAVGAPAREIGTFLLTPPNRASTPLLRWYRLMTAGLLPERLRAPFGLRFGAFDRRLFDASHRTLRATYPQLPRRLRDVPAFVEAERRLRGEEAEDRFGRMLEKLALGVVKPARAEPEARCPVPHRRAARAR